MTSTSGTKARCRLVSSATFLDGRELRLLRLDVEVDVLELADPVTLAVDQLAALPFAEVAMADDRFGNRLSLGWLGIGRGSRPAP